MQKMTVWSIDVFQSCNLLTHFHQAQWHSLYIRISEHRQKKEKDSLKTNQNQPILLLYLKQPNTTFLSSPRSSWRSSIHLRLGDCWLILQKGALEFRGLTSIIRAQSYFFLNGENMNVYGSINHSALTIISLAICTCSSARVTEEGRNKDSNGRKAALQTWSGL